MELGSTLSWPRVLAESDSWQPSTVRCWSKGATLNISMILTLKSLRSMSELTTTGLSPRTFLLRLLRLTKCERSPLVVGGGFGVAKPLLPLMSPLPL